MKNEIKEGSRVKVMRTFSEEEKPIMNWRPKLDDQIGRVLTVESVKRHDGMDYVSTDRGDYPIAAVKKVIEVGEEVYYVYADFDKADFDKYVEKLKKKDVRFDEIFHSYDESTIGLAMYVRYCRMENGEIVSMDDYIDPIYGKKVTKKEFKALVRGDIEIYCAEDVELPKIFGHIPQIKGDKVEVGCQTITKEEVEFIVRLYGQGARLSIYGERLTRVQLQAIVDILI